jgi:hypothetical protein
MFRKLILLLLALLVADSLEAKRDLLTGLEVDDKSESSFNQRRYSNLKPSVLRRDLVIYAFPGATLSAEQSAILKSVWEDVKIECTYTEEGDIEQTFAGQKLSDAPEMTDAFYRWLSKNEVKRKSRVEERCTNCRGAGILITYGETVKDRLQYARNPCPSCSGTGRTAVEINYSIVCPEDKAPPKGRTPKLRRFDEVQLLAAKGDVNARLKLAEMLATGKAPTGIDRARAKEIYFGLMAQGELDAIRGFIEMYPKEPADPSEVKFVCAIQMALAHMTKSTVISSKDFDVPLDGFEVEILAERFRSLFEGKSMALRHLSYDGLSRAAAGVGLSPVRRIISDHLRSGKRSYDSKEVAELMLQAENLDPEAFVLLGCISELGLAGVSNPSGAYIYYSIAQKLRAKVDLRACLYRVKDSADSASLEVLHFFPKATSNDKCSRTYIQSVFDLEMKSK